MYRIPRLAVPACVTLFLLGCESPVAPWHPTNQPPPPPPPLSVEISGPSQIDAEGTYTWEAFAFGGSGAYQYQWDVTRHAGGAVKTFTQRKLSLHILATDGDYSLKLTLTSGAEVRSESLDVSNCMSRCRYLVRRN